jgi:Fe-S cluster biosynthesis and repair protein YggX
MTAWGLCESGMLARARFPATRPAGVCVEIKDRENSLDFLVLPARLGLEIINPTSRQAGLIKKKVRNEWLNRQSSQQKKKEQTQC